MAYGIIYLATNLANGKMYVGQTTVALELRIYRHEWKANNGSTLYFHNSLRKHGVQGFEWRVIDEANSAEEWCCVYWWECY